jgi:hypothetical protein
MILLLSWPHSEPLKGLWLWLLVGWGGAPWERVLLTRMYGWLWTCMHGELDPFKAEAGDV